MDEKKFASFILETGLNIGEEFESINKFAAITKLI